ncbi:integrase catalytic domain-containing protein [Nephila pilipes]|uniref:Integrase catalytic domain-containing protein n=1 Tax=Nephila pilipes TaxID=299642 RepID=A0A8X6R0F8_NEPPI|nr:integrase catalytic domain-containing protein [Nephila pilipes]GFS65637.1 integrase catalytic domain-containing protein [Nephila pilipes]GFT59214.1 integrase catalytic domain-containing protein [Nephila pilipes]GFU49656.1 integrase catalytic domain-containing protein [Nephila pilipes]
MDKFNRIKRSIKGSITKLETFVNEKTVVTDTSSIKIKVKLKEIENLQTKLNELCEKYYEIPDIRDIEEIESDLDEDINRLEQREKHIEQFHSEHPTATSLLDFCLYVDDLIAGEDIVQDALEFSRGAKQIMQKTGMVLRKWITNESDLMDRWKQEGIDTQQQHNSISLEYNLTKVLGMAWNTAEDCITVEIQSLLEFLSSKRNTKHFILQ